MLSAYSIEDACDRRLLKDVCFRRTSASVVVLCSPYLESSPWRKAFTTRICFEFSCSRVVLWYNKVKCEVKIEREIEKMEKREQEKRNLIFFHFFFKSFGVWSYNLFHIVAQHTANKHVHVVRPSNIALDFFGRLFFY